MSDLKWLMTLQFSLIKNHYWSDQKTKSRTFFGLLVLLALMYLLTKLVFNSFSIDLDPTNIYYKEIVFILFSIIIVWVFFMSFIQGLSSYVKTFYKSPEMNHLITLPISFKTLFLFIFVKHIFISNKSMLLLFVPFSATIGLLINAPILYYFLIIPIFFLIATIPTSVSTLVALVSLKFLSAKAFSLITTVASLILNILFALSFTRSEAIFTNLYPHISSILEIRFILDIIPITSGARLLMTIGNVETYFYSMLFFLITAISIVLIGFGISKKFYFVGWEKNQIVNNRNVKKSLMKIRDKELSSLDLIFYWMKSEWKMALRNYDMFIAALSMLSFYVLATLAFSFGSFFSDDPVVAISILILVSTIFNVMSVSLLFLPSELSKDKTLWKNRYWILKTVPFDSKHVLIIQSLMYFIPAYLFSLSGLLLFAFATEISFSMFLVSGLVMFISLYGASLLYVTTEMLSLSEFFEKNSQIGNLMTIILPFLYGITSVGLTTLVLSKAYIVNYRIAYDIANALSIQFTVIVSILVIVLSVIFAHKIFVPVWKKLEIF